jgi:hypothetical protein
MKRATISVSDELASAIEAYRRDQELAPSLTAVTEAALAEYLSQRGYLKPRRALRIRPAEKGSGDSRGSIEHDRILAGQ